MSVNKNFINNSNTDQYFGMELGYDKNPSIGAHNPQYNGNIAGMVWKSEGDQQRRKYDFTYDAVNRLTSAYFTQYVSGSGSSAVFDKSAGIDFSERSITYDANGNILTLSRTGLKLNNSPVIDSLLYTYTANTNKLLKVYDRVTGSDNGKLGDFKDGANGTGNDYTLDLNGNMTVDNNKAISSIAYNHLNLPGLITITGKGTIAYTYTATGVKLRKTVTETSTSVNYNGTNYTTAITTTTTYLGGAIYESKDYSHASLTPLEYTDKLLHMAHEEGRIRFEKATTSTCPSLPDRLVFDYFLKDHLGNVRTVLTEQKEDICYIPATVEDSRYASEDDFYNIVDSRRIDKTLTGATQGSFENKLYRTHGGLTNEKTGLGIVLKVMSGDKVKISAESYYTLPGGNAGTPLDIAVSELLTSFVGSPILTASKGALTTTDVSNLGNNNSLLDNLNAGNPGSNIAKAYVNWILFDEQLRYVSAGADPVQTGGGYKQHTAWINTPPTMSKNGFLYIYVSNESNLAVFFDNLVVTHTPGPILEETHYYPFGLGMAGISSKALKANYAGNKNKYNGGNEIQSGEFSDNAGLELYDAVNRLYDPQLGRFWQVDELAEGNWEWTPYNFAINNPISFNDPLGLKEGPNDVKNLEEVVVRGVKKYTHNQMQSIYWQLKDGGIDFSRVRSEKLRERLIRWDGIQQYMDKVHAMTRESDKVVLEVGSFFIPSGWLLKIRHLKWAVGLFKIKRGVSAFNSLKYASQFGIKAYRELKKISPDGSQVHHLIEKRFANLFEKAEKDMASIVLTKEEHQIFTNAWRDKIGYEGSNAATTTFTATKEQVENAAREIYKNYPEILKALELK